MNNLKEDQKLDSKANKGYCLQVNDTVEKDGKNSFEHLIASQTADNKIITLRRFFTTKDRNAKLGENKLKPEEKLLKKTRVFKCLYEDCGKSFHLKWILDRHIDSHFCFKIYKCNYTNCIKAYKSSENLLLHVRNKHLGEKPYQCRFCELKFSHRNGKTYHERTVHINFLPFMCDAPDCNLKFACKSALTVHFNKKHKF